MTPTPTPLFKGKLAVQQRVLPSYRANFFDTLANQTQKGMFLFAGYARKEEMIKSATQTKTAVWQKAHNIHLFKGKFYLCWQKNNLAWLKKTNPDVLITEANPRYLSTDRLIRWMHANNKPVIGWGLGAPQPTGLLGKFRTYRRKKFLQKFDALIAYSQNGAEEYKRLGFPKDRVFTAYNAVAPKPKQKPATKPDTFNGKPILLFVGRLQERKRLDNLIKACAQLPESIQPTLWIIGDGPAKESLETLANNTYPHTFFFGAVHGETLSEYFYKADCFVLPGTGGLAIQEAMAHGLPVIVAEGDGTQNDLVRPKNGWLINPNQSNHLILTLTEALQHPAKLRKMGEEGFRIADQEININAMANQFIHIINQTLGEIQNKND